MPPTTRARTNSPFVAPPPTEAVLFDPALLLTILSYANLPAVAAVATACRELHQMAISATQWEQRLRRQFPVSVPLIGPIQARGGSVCEFYRKRVEELAFERVESPTEEGERERLGRAMSDTFVELQVTDKKTGKVLGARVVSAFGEEAVLLSLFNGEAVLLTYTTDVDLYYGDDSVRMTDTLLRLTPEPQTVLLGQSDDRFDGNYWSSLWDGCTYNTDSPLVFPAAMYVEVSYITLFTIRQQTRELAIRLSPFTSWVDGGVKEMEFKSAVEMWGFLNFLLTAKPLWETE